MPLKQTFLERTPTVPDDVIDKLEELLRSKIDLMTGYAEAHVEARRMYLTLRILDTSDDRVITPESFPLLMKKLNCGDDLLAVDALYHRFDRRGDGRITLQEFSDALFGLKPVAGSKLECRDIIKLVRARLLERGENGFRDLACILHRIDDNGNRRITNGELRQGLSAFNVRLSKYELDTLFHFFDVKADDMISANEFLTGIRPKMSEARCALIKLVYLRLDKNSEGVITFDMMKEIYIPEKHPAVLRGEKTSQEVMSIFEDSWWLKGNNIITERDFYDYYNDISATIDNDEYFELLVRNTWRIAGGEGPVEHGQKKIHLMVTHMNGKKTIETLDGDLVIDTSSKEGLAASLRKQGVTDILKVEPAMYV